MQNQNEDILRCLRNKSIAELTRFRFVDKPSFLTAMGPSRDGIIIPSDFGLEQGRMSPPRRGSSSSSSFFPQQRSSRKLRSQQLGSYQVLFLASYVLRKQNYEKIAV